jgi:hypothetical protein
MTDSSPPPAQPTTKQARNAEILERLRAAFGEERDNELADVDGLGMLALFLRPLPRLPDAAADTDGTQSEEPLPAPALSRSDLAELRRQKRLHRREAAAAHGPPLTPEDHLGRPGYAAFLDELPQLREHFGTWLASVDADSLPSSSSLEELQALRIKTEQRLRLLTTMAAETQRELDQLIVNIRAMQAAGQQ